MGNTITTEQSQDSWWSKDTSSRSSSSSGNAMDDDDAETIVCSAILTGKPSPFGGQRPKLLPCSPSSLLSDHDDEEGDAARCSVPKTSSWSSLSDFGGESYYTKQELDMKDGDLPTPETDLRPSEERVRSFWIVTTAALPWMTGTAINPLLRAAYFSQLNRPYAGGRSTVTLVIPWLETEQDRVALYGEPWKGATKADQDAYIRKWLAQSLPEEADLSQGGIQIVFYPARYHARYGSIFAMGDICQLFGQEKLDVCFLEEPEHLNVYRAPGNRLWADIFSLVVGVAHTNYSAYVQKESLVASAVTHGLSAWMVQAYCHKLIKLSPVLQRYAQEKEVVCNIHGIRSEFLMAPCPTNGVYFLGKLVWAKGLDMLLKLETIYRKQTGQYFDIDIIGSGPDQEEIKAAFEAKKPSVPARFLGRQDHLEVCVGYKIFVNPSVSEVLCTATAEAIAMGKFVLCPVHPSNTFFEIFPNCLQYHSKKEFCKLLAYALQHNPEPLSEDLRYILTWEAATQRCLEASVITRRDAARLERIGKTKAQRDLAKLHNDLNRGSTGKVFRAVLGAGPLVHQHEVVVSVGGS